MDNDNNEKCNWNCDGCEECMDSTCDMCGDEMTWCNCCQVYSSNCCQEYGTCACS